MLTDQIGGRVQPRKTLILPEVAEGETLAPPPEVFGDVAEPVLAGTLLAQ